MTGPWTIRETGMCVGAVILALSIAYLSGKHSGQLEQRLADNKTAIHASDSSTKSVQIRTEHQKAVTAVLDSTHDIIRSRVILKHDSVIVRDTVYVIPQIAQLIASDDSLIAAQKHSLALQDTLVASLHVGITLRDQRIALLERQHSPRLGIKSGIAIGAVSTVAIVVVAVKVIQAFHK